MPQLSSLRSPSLLGRLSHPNPPSRLLTQLRLPAHSRHSFHLDNHSGYFCVQVPSYNVADVATASRNRHPVKVVFKDLLARTDSSSIVLEHSVPLAPFWMRTKLESLFSGSSSSATCATTCHAQKTVSRVEPEDCVDVYALLLSLFTSLRANTVAQCMFSCALH